MTRRLLLSAASHLFVGALVAQAPGVPIHEDSSLEQPSAEEKALRAAIEELRTAGVLMDMAAVRAQLDRRHCELTLPPVRSTRLDGPDVWRAARTSYVRVGWFYRCTHCPDWHLDLAGGYAIAAGGAVATCHHVILPDDEEMKEGVLVCADEAGKVYAVREVLACDEPTDVAILRTDCVAAPPLPLRVDVVPGEKAFVFSDPMGSRGYFSAGIVNRFVREPIEDTNTHRVVVDVGADWAPGSSGAAVLDERGNAIGHAATISTHDEETEEPVEVPPTEAAKGDAAKPPPAPRARSVTYMALHQAVRAHDVLALVRPPPAVPKAKEATK